MKNTRYSFVTKRISGVAKPVSCPFCVQRSDVLESAKEVREIWNQQGITGRGLACVQLVYGIAGHAVHLIHNNL